MTEHHPCTRLSGLSSRPWAKALSCVLQPWWGRRQQARHISHTSEHAPLETGQPFSPHDKNSLSSRRPRVSPVALLARDRPQSLGLCPASQEPGDMGPRGPGTKRRSGEPVKATQLLLSKG